jgi:chorismate mutase
MRQELERRIAELSAEIRAYPGPIARCDVQLTALLEERARLLHQLENHVACSPEAIWTNDGGR